MILLCGRIKLLPIINYVIYFRKDKTLEVYKLELYYQITNYVGILYRNTLLHSLRIKNCLFSLKKICIEISLVRII